MNFDINSDKLHGLTYPVKTMKNTYIKKLPFLILILAVVCQGIVFSQEEPPDFQLQPKMKSVIIKNDGTEYIGTILSRDAREVLIDVDNLGQIFIPMHEIREIRDLDEKGEYSSGEAFSSRYFLSTSGLPLTKGQRYALFNWWGPEIHSNVAENFSMGLMTTWIAVPLIASMKVSIPVSEKFNFGIGTLLGSGLWAGLGNVGGLIYGSATIGDHVNNLTLSGGYVGISLEGDNVSSPLASVACLIKINQNLSFVGDSFIILKKGSSGALIIPGIRYSKANDKAFQFGFGGIVAEGGSVPIPFPYFGFFRAF